MKCKCYCEEYNYAGDIGKCNGTRERDACSCGGDEAKCDFYPEVRKRAKKPLTKADRIRAMTDDELADAMEGLVQGFISIVPSSMLDTSARIGLTLFAASQKEYWLNLLKQETGTRERHQKSPPAKRNLLAANATDQQDATNQRGEAGHNDTPF